MVRLSLAVLLACLCAGVSAREVSMHSPNGETGTCPEVEAPANTAAPKTTRAAPARSSAKPAGKPTTTQGGGGDSAVRTQGPRWHSFLPGMFR